MLKTLLIISALVVGISVEASSDGRLPIGVESLLLQRLETNPGKIDASSMLRSALTEAERLGDLDELKGCVTKTRTICVGVGKERECTTDSWEVCVSNE